MDSLFHLYARNDGGGGGGAGDTLIIAAPSVPPYTTPALTANLVFRVLLGIMANIICIVPLRLLYTNGELAAFVFIVNLMFKNILTVVNALIWRDDHVESWWPGYGFCDVSAFLHNFTLGLFATCLLAITRNLAIQVGLMRANPLTVREKRRKNLVQALIMFPLPLLQLVLTWLLTAQRYAVGTLIGCSWIGYGAWPYLVFFLLIPLAVSLMTVGYAILTYLRFREVANTTKSALSSNQTVSTRAQRTRRRLYLMIVTIIIPYFPITVALCIVNIVDMGPIKPYDYDAIHNATAGPYPWNSIFYITSKDISFILMNDAYIPILTSIPVFCYFGLTSDAFKEYRGILEFVGLGNAFPRLFVETRSENRYVSQESQDSSDRYASRKGSVDPKLGSIASSYPLSTISSTPETPAHDNGPASQSLDFISSVQEGGQDFSSPTRAPDAAPISYQAPYDTTIHRNPFLMRTYLDVPVPFKIPIPGFLKSSKNCQGSNIAISESVPLDSSSQPNQQPLRGGGGGIQTHVWSEDEDARRLCGDTHHNHHHRNSHSNDNSDRRSVISDNAVRIETLFTRETHEAGVSPPQMTHQPHRQQQQKQQRQQYHRM